MAECPDLTFASTLGSGVSPFGKLALLWMIASFALLQHASLLSIVSLGS